MSITLYDAVADLITLLGGKWNTNIGGTKPEISAIWDKKSAGFGDSFRDQILIQPSKEIIKMFALHADAFLSEAPITLDIRTYSGILRHDATVKEAVKILKNNARRATTGFIDIRVTGVSSYNKDYRNVFRATIDLIYRDLDSLV